MKRLLSIIGAISLVGTSTTSLIACNKSQYTEDELKKEKEKHKIDTKDQTIRDNLEWMAPQEKPFNQVDNKYYYIVWRGDKNDNWRIVKFINNDAEIERFKPKKLDEKNNIILYLAKFDDITLSIDGSTINIWNKNNDYIKTVYRWNLDTKELDLIVDNDGTVKVKDE